MIDAHLALAFASGMLATVNPCGFAMLPAYLSYFVGAKPDAREKRPRPGASIARALSVGAAVSAGFMVLFALAGALLTWMSIGVYDIAPWITLVIGAGLVGLGIAMLLGKQVYVALPKLDKGGRSRTLGSMFLFGVSYAIASLGCTLPVFLSTVSGTFQRSNVASGIAVYLMYALGMTLVLMALTVTISLARQSLVRGLRRAMPYITRVAGGLVVLAGAYVAWYGSIELRTRKSGAVTSGRAVDTVTNWSSSIGTWVDHVGATRLGLALGLVVAVAAFVGMLRADTSR